MMVAYYSMAGHASNNISHQAWAQSPVPYLIGGVAAMVGLVAIALLILACSFRNLSGQFEENNGGEQYNNAAAASAAESGEKKIDLFREDTEAKVVVIMPGDEKPTFLAKPAMSSAGDLTNMV